MTASVENGDLYRLKWVPNIEEILNKEERFNQILPSKENPARCHMTRVLNTISNTTRIIHDPVAPTNELIIDSGCSDHMFNTNVQLTDYDVFRRGEKNVQVANGLSVPVLGVGKCGFLNNPTISIRTGIDGVILPDYIRGR